MHKYEYHYAPYTRYTKKSKIDNLLNWGIVVVSFCILFVLAYSIYKIVTRNIIQNVVISPVADSVASSVDNMRKMVFPEKLDAVVQSILSESDGTYAVAIKNLKTGEAYYYNQEKKFQSASLYKLWVLGEAYRQIEYKKLDKDKVLKAEVSEINKKFDIASESAELTEGTVTARVQDAIQQMIVISSNYSALLLVTEIKLSNVEKYLKDYGFSDSKTGSPPITTARDIEGFFEKLYAGLLGSKDSTASMIATLQSQQLNDRIPKYLPEDVEVAHKTGELDGYKHDAGIVFAPSGDYIIVILSKTTDEAKAAEQEALLSKAVYEYFESK